MALLTALLLLSAGCSRFGGAQFGGNRLEPIVAALSSEDENVRKQAAERLRSLAQKGLSQKEGQYALEKAARRFPPRKNELENPAEELVAAAANVPFASYVPVVSEHFTDYPPPAQAAALRLLGTLEGREAAQALVEALPRASEKTSVLSLGTLAEKPRHAEVLFPALVEELDRPSLRWQVSNVTLAYLSSGAIRDAETKARISKAMIEIHHGLARSLLPKQQATGVGWMFEDGYQESRSLEALVLDVLGHVGTPEAESELRGGLHYSDPRLKQFAVLGLVRRGKDVSPDDVRSVARSSECRNWLYRNLVEMGKGDLFPRDLATQAAFAESEMVDWLTYPTELARVPDEIELTDVVPDPGGGEPGAYYEGITLDRRARRDLQHVREVGGADSEGARAGGRGARREGESEPAREELIRVRRREP